MKNTETEMVYLISVSSASMVPTIENNTLVDTRIYPTYSAQKTVESKKAVANIVPTETIIFYSILIAILITFIKTFKGKD